MKVETILKVTSEYQFAMARNRKEVLCVLISKSVRAKDVDGLESLVGSREVAEQAINAYKSRPERTSAYASLMEVA